MSNLSDLPAEYLGKAAKMLLAQTDTMHQDQETLLRDSRNRQREHQRRLLGLPDAPQEGDEMRIVADNITIQHPPAPQPPLPRQALGMIAKTAIAAGLLGSGGAAAIGAKYLIDRIAKSPAVQQPSNTTTINREGWIIDVGN